MRRPLHPQLVQASLALLLMLVSGAGMTWAQGGDMELTVTDEAGKPLRDVEVSGVTEATGDVVVSATTNKKGVAKLAFPAPGFYSLEISKSGFPDQLGRVEIREKMTSSLAVTLYDEATLTKQQAVDAFNAGVAKLQGRGQEAAALEDFVEAAKLDPSLADAHRLAAILGANLGEMEVTESAMNAYLAMVPEGMPAIAPAVYTVYRKNGRTADLPPVRAALQAAGFANDVAIGVFNEGVQALKDDKADAGRAMFIEALALDPSLSVAHRSLAALEFNDGNYSAALPHLENLLGLSPEHRDGNRMAFFCYAALGKKTEAIAVGKAWAERDKNAAEEISAKAAESYENGKAAEARTYAELTMAIDPDSPYGNYTMGRVLAGAGDIAQAKEHLRRFIQLAPNHPEAASAQAMIDGL